MKKARPGWAYDEFAQIGLDFADAAQVAAYDQRQGDTSAANTALLRQAGVTAGQVVVDLGTGTGAFAMAAARIGADVHAVDVSRAMLDHARAKAQVAGLGSVTFHHAGFLTYEHALASADLVVSQFALHHLSDFWKQAAFMRIAAMLKPGGLFILRDVMFSFDPKDQDMSVEAWIAAMASAQGKGWSRADFESHVRDEHSTYAWIVEGMLTRAGFTVESRDCPTPAYATFLARRRREAAAESSS